MKKVILFLALIAPSFLIAQIDESKIWEKAVFEVNHNNATIYYTDVNSLDGPFNEEILDDLEAAMLRKEGIVKVEFAHVGHAIRVYHFDYIELETIKYFVLKHTQEIEVMTRKEYTF
jgi:hypothetical protein